MWPQHVSRHVHATVLDLVSDYLELAGWVHDPVNFGTTPVTILDEPPDDRGAQIAPNTVAVSLGDVGDDILGQVGGGLWSRIYPIFVDIYGAERSIAVALADDVRAAFPESGLRFPLIDQVDASEVAGASLGVERILGPERPAGAESADTFRRHWRVVRVQLDLEFSGS
jgi:hypothetical protein